MTPKAHFVIYSLVTLILYFVKKLLSICYKSHYAKPYRCSGE